MAPRHRLVALASVAALLAGCGDDVGSSDPIALDDVPDGTEIELLDDGPAPDQPEATSPLGEVVDASVAEPGTWQVGEAGTVTFAIDGGALRLEEVVAADGWQITEQDANDDDLEIEFARSSERYLFEVELDDGTRLAVRIEHDLERVPGGTYALGDAGAVEVRLANGRLVVERVTVADGWQVVAEEREGDELELDLVRGDQRWHVEIEVDDEDLDVEIVYEVRGTV
jgi:hypothetical protein